MQSLLIKDTTRAQREEIVRRALSACGSPCDGCNGCGNAGGGRLCRTNVIASPTATAIARTRLGWASAQSTRESNSRFMRSA